ETPPARVYAQVYTIASADATAGQSRSVRRPNVLSFSGGHMLGVHGGQMKAQGLDQGLGDHGPAILSALAVADVKLTLLQIDVLHPQLERLEQTQAAAVEEAHDDAHRTI